MHVERVTVTNFRCFGPQPVEIELDEQLTALIGSNASGKTAALLAMLRLFGVSQDLRRVRVEDFHVPADEDPDARPTQRELSVDVIIAFPELEADADEETDAVPEFFQQMAADAEGKLKCRLRLEATWQADGSASGSITETRRVIRTLVPSYADDEWSELRAADRARIQMIYVPAARDGAQHLTAFLRGRLWRAASWGKEFRESVATASKSLNQSFSEEPPVAGVQEVLTQRWNELHAAGTDMKPSFRPVSTQFDGFVDRADLFFEPTETGQPRNAGDLSDGQRSLLHIALTATALDIEGDVASGKRREQFDGAEMGLPTLTILAVEEPENSLAPYFLARIVGQMIDLGESRRAQMLLSSHSPSVLSRVEPRAVRHFQVDVKTRTALVNAIPLPTADEEASKYVREAVRAFPELYFARFVVLGEGPSEQVALPLLAKARGIVIDRSFVAIVPLGGRHVNHMWRLLNQLGIPHATLLDLDWGRAAAGTQRVKTVHAELAAIGVDVAPDGPEAAEPQWDIENLEAGNVDAWIDLLHEYNVYFCAPLDLDWALMTSFWDDYRSVPEGGRGPGTADATAAVLGDQAEDSDHYQAMAEQLRWYRYLFLGRSKPATHLRVLSGIDSNRLADEAPEVLAALIGRIQQAVN